MCVGIPHSAVVSAQVCAEPVEMACTPLDVPIEFVAEIDIGSGKVQLTRLPVAT